MDRRAQLRLTQEEFAHRAGMAVKTLQRVESGKVNPHPKTLGALDTAAEWPDGHSRRIRDGEEDYQPSTAALGETVDAEDLPDPLTMEWFILLRERLPKTTFDQVVRYVKIAQVAIAESDHKEAL